MSKNNGSEAPEKRQVSKEEIAAWVNRDIENSVSILNLIRTDPEILAAITEIVVERVRVREEAKAAQPELDLKS